MSLCNHVERDINGVLASHGKVIFSFPSVVAS